MTQHVAIIGGGFAGTLTAINLLNHDGPRATLIERAPDIGRGIAYSTGAREHLLNVRAGNMSAYPDDLQHFARWLARHGGGSPASFAARRLYGDYLAEQLAAAAATATDRLTIVRQNAVAIARSKAGLIVSLENRARIATDAAVVATGNLPPHAPPPLDPDALGPDRYSANPWADDLGHGLTDHDTVLLLGTGLTMVDAALLLIECGFKGRLVALSRRGLLPRVHDDEQPPTPLLSERPPAKLATLLRFVRQSSRSIGWRGAVDSLRPYTQSIWRAASNDDRARFLRHLRPWWDVHRHRIAPAVAARLQALIISGKLTILAGTVQRYVANRAGVDIEWRKRGEAEIQPLSIRRIINCTGPQGDLSRSSDPFIRHVLDTGLARVDAHRLGLDVDADSRVLDAHGRPQDDLYAVGSITRGAFWEVSAVPDIRQQVWTLARKLAKAHWIEGEGL